MDFGYAEPRHPRIHLSLLQRAFGTAGWRFFRPGLHVFQSRYEAVSVGHGQQLQYGNPSKKQFEGLHSFKKSTPPCCQFCCCCCSICRRPQLTRKAASESSHIDVRLIGAGQGVVPLPPKARSADTQRHVSMCDAFRRMEAQLLGKTLSAVREVLR